MKYTLIITLIALTFIAACTANGAVVIDRAQSAPMPTALVTLPDNAIYTLDSSESTLRYGAYRFTGKGHQGTVDIARGTLTRTDAEFTSGDFTIDMTTITEDNNNTRYLAHVRSEDFFDIEQYPTSTFVVKSIIQNGNALDVTGDLTILDRTNEITFPATLETTTDGIRMTASFTIDRTHWGITYDSASLFSELGDRAIKDDIDYALNLVFKQ